MRKTGDKSTGSWAMKQAKRWSIHRNTSWCWDSNCFAKGQRHNCMHTFPLIERTKIIEKQRKGTHDLKNSWKDKHSWQCKQWLKAGENREYNVLRSYSDVLFVFWFYLHRSAHHLLPPTAQWMANRIRNKHGFHLMNEGKGGAFQLCSLSSTETLTWDFDLEVLLRFANATPAH